MTPLLAGLGTRALILGRVDVRQAGRQKDLCVRRTSLGLEAGGRGTSGGLPGWGCGEACGEHSVVLEEPRAWALSLVEKLR